MARDIIVIGGSAGAIGVLRRLVAALPADLAAAIFVVVHIPPEAPSLLASILESSGALPASMAVEGEPIRRSRIYVAPPDHHMLVKPGWVSVIKGPRENRHRPAVDPLFRSAARAYRERVIAVVLSGGRDDGAAGLEVVRQLGGVAVVQAPSDASAPWMPQAALTRTGADHTVPLVDMANLLARLVRDNVPRNGEIPMDEELRDPVERGPQDYSEPATGLTCPECSGAIWEIEGSYRCRVGHAYSPESMRAAQEEALEAALWTALRIVEERMALLRRMMHRAEAAGQVGLGGLYIKELSDLEHQEGLLRRALIPDPEGRAI